MNILTVKAHAHLYVKIFLSRSVVGYQATPLYQITLALVKIHPFRDVRESQGLLLSMCPLNRGLTDEIYRYNFVLDFTFSPGGIMLFIKTCPF